MSPHDSIPLLVIATSGLKLREGPGTQFKTIATAPFGAEVTMLELTDMPHDTVQKFSIKHNEEYTAHTNVQATWMKVRYGENVGYMYSLYLYHKFRQREYPGHPEINRKYLVFSKTNDMVNSDLKSLKQNYWYEIYQKPEGDFSLNSIKVEMSSSLEHIQNCGGGMQLIVQRADRKSNSIILYSDKRLKTGRLKTQAIGDFNEQLRTIEELERLKKIDRDEFVIIKNKLLEKFSFREIDSKIYFNKNGDEVLFFKDWNITGIHMVADLDGDGIMDYIIHFGEYNQTLMGLFLSSEADDGKSHKLVATFAGHFNC